MQRSGRNSVTTTTLSGERHHSREQEDAQGRRGSKDRNTEPIVRSTVDRRDAREARETRALRNPLHVPQASGYLFSQAPASHIRHEDLDYRENHEEAKDEGGQPRAGSRSRPGTRIAAGAGSHADNAQIRVRETVGSSGEAGGQLFGSNRSLSRGSYLRDDHTDPYEDYDSQNRREAHEE